MKTELLNFLSEKLLTTHPATRPAEGANTETLSQTAEKIKRSACQVKGDSCHSGYCRVPELNAGIRRESPGL
jgi:hypothetical protein